MRYRFNEPGFEHLHGLLEDDIKTKNTDKAKANRAAGAVCSRTRLAIFLRYLAGGMIEDIYLIYCVSKQECYPSMWRVTGAIHGCQQLEIKFPIDDIEALKKLEAAMRGRSANANSVGGALATHPPAAAKSLDSSHTRAIPRPPSALRGSLVPPSRPSLLKVHQSVEGLLELSHDALLELVEERPLNVLGRFSVRHERTLRCLVLLG